MISYQVGFKRDENTLTIDRRTKIYGTEQYFVGIAGAELARRTIFLSFQRNERFIVLANKISI